MNKGISVRKMMRRLQSAGKKTFLSPMEASLRKWLIICHTTVRFLGLYPPPSAHSPWCHLVSFVTKKRKTTARSRNYPGRTKVVSLFVFISLLNLVCRIMCVSRQDASDGFFVTKNEWIPASQRTPVRQNCESIPTLRSSNLGSFSLRFSSTR